MTNFIPIRNQLLIKKIEDELTTRSGLKISDDAKERPTKGKVLATGDGKLTEHGNILPMVVKTGDTVLYPKYAGHPVKLNFEEYLILNEDEILGIIKEENE